MPKNRRKGYSLDGQYEAQEAQAVRTAASLLGVPIDVVDALEGVVEMEGPLRTTRHRLLRSTDY
jgi:tellurite resistance protein